jgi:hypothetical protein
MPFGEPDWTEPLPIDAMSWPITRLNPGRPTPQETDVTIIKTVVELGEKPIKPKRTTSGTDEKRKRAWSQWTSKERKSAEKATEANSMEEIAPLVSNL